MLMLVWCLRLSNDWSVFGTLNYPLKEDLWLPLRSLRKLLCAKIDIITASNFRNSPQMNIGDNRHVILGYFTIHSFFPAAVGLINKARDPHLTWTLIPPPHLKPVLC